MEQLLRIGEPDQVKAFLEAWDKRGYGQPLEDLPVYGLKEAVDQRAVPLGSGKFDKGECRGCRRNTDCQLRLFGGEDDKKAKCLDAACFKRKQQAWYDVNWRSCKQNKFGTLTALVTDQYTNGSGSFYDYGVKPQEQCSSCDKFTTTIRMNGEVWIDRCCLGEAKCYNQARKQTEDSKKQSCGAECGGSKKEEDGAPRVEWHGEHFRQAFYREQIPQLLDGLLTEDQRRLQLSLACLIYFERNELSAWFYQKLGNKVPNMKHDWQRFSLTLQEIIELVSSLKPLQVEYLLAQATVQAAFFSRSIFTDQDRQAIAQFLGIDFSRYQVTDEYLQKKTKGELIRLIVELGLNEEEGFRKYAGQHIGYHYYEGNEGRISIEKLAGVKKPTLINLILNCGGDLHGRLPKEIADRPKLKEQPCN
jgi:hypothetical protein